MRKASQGPPALSEVWFSFFSPGSAGPGARSAQHGNGPATWGQAGQLGRAFRTLRSGIESWLLVFLRVAVDQAFDVSGI